MRTEPTNPRPSGIRSIGELPWGTHFCVFYATGRELLDVLVPFVQAGLEANELCSWEVDAPLTVDAATTALARAVPDFAKYVARGQLELVPPPAAAGADDALERRLDRATLADFDGLRLVRHAAASMERGAVEDLGRLNVVAAYACPRAELGVVELMQRVQEHPFALVCNSGRWEVLAGSQARTADAALQRSEEKLESLFRNMSEGFAYHRIVLDAGGRPCDYVFLEMNPAFERLTGLVARESIGRRVTRVIPGIEADPTDWIGTYGRVALKGEPVHFESHAVALGRWYAVSAFSTRKGYFAVTFTDVTERRRAEAERVQAQKDLREANHRLQDADRRKDEFLAMLSHELRNPLAPIQNSLYILDRTPPGGEQARRSIEVIRRQSAHLSRLVDDLLDVTRIARGKIRLQRERVDLVDVVRRTIDDYRASFADAGIRFGGHMPDRALWADADSTRIAQVVGNLLGNALKFTPRGGKVELTLRDEQGWALLRVRDSGVGIAAGIVERLFQPFTQAEQTLDRSHGGLGLGLALVKGLVELHGGSATAASDGAGRGAEFTVRLPLASAPERVTPASASPPVSRRRVLVIEDNPDAARSLAEVLEMWGHEVEVANDGATGIAAARIFRPEFVLCDIGLPGMSGHDVARAFRADPELGTAYLVALTGYALPEDIQRATESGFRRHLAKPPSLDALEDLLASLEAEPSRARRNRSLAPQP
jgi:two-component system CheB/CheR fusion protein